MPKVQIIISSKFMNIAEIFFTRKAQHIQCAEGLTVGPEMAALGQEANRNVWNTQAQPFVGWGISDISPI